MSESVYSNSMSSSREISDELNSTTISSEYVNNLVEPILHEFQAIILVHGENVVKNLMPLVGQSLDTLNKLFTEKHSLEVELELLKEDTSQLMNQYEKEKLLRRKADENLFRAEDCLSEKVTKYEDKIQHLESQIKMHEIRYRNLQEQILRSEEREVKLSKENELLYHRYQELMKFQVDYVEKSKLSHNERSSKQSFTNSANLNSFQFCQDDLDPSDNSETESSDKEFYKLKPTDDTGTPFGDDISEMTNEIEYIIKENDELRATKNALNIVKDDLITKLDEANSEIEVLQHQNETLSMYKANLKLKVNELDQETKSLKQEVQQLKMKLENQSEDESIPISQRKRFTRAEMTRVLLERNHFKEKLSELEDYLRWYKYINSKEKKMSLWEKVANIFKPEKNQSNNSSKPTTPVLRKQQVKRSPKQSSCEALQDPRRIQSCGWSISTEHVEMAINIPVPIFCKPITETKPNFKIACATVVELDHDDVNDGNIYIGDSIFYDGQYKNTQVEINQDKSKSYQNHNYIWIGLTSEDETQIVITDALRSTETIDTFIIPNCVVQCIACIPGYRQSNSNNQVTNENSSFSEIPTNDLNTTISLVKCVSYTSINTMEDDNITEGKSESGSESVNTAEYNSSNSTVWIGCEDGNLFIHPISGRRSQCLKQVQLPDSITNIKFHENNVFVSLANGKIVRFTRYIESNNEDMLNKSFSGQWNISEYLLIENHDLIFSIRTMENVPISNALWVGYKNSIMIIDNQSFKQIHKFEAHPKPEYHVRQMCWIGDGMWVSLRMDVVLRLYHVTTYQHLQDLNLEPHINKLIEPSVLGLTVLRISCIAILENCLWVGISNGMILSAPFHKLSNEMSFKTVANGQADNFENDQPSLSCVHPTINQDYIKLSYHGHRDSVKFFVSFFRDSLSNLNSSKIVVKKPVIMSGGEGYKDFRINDHSPMNKSLKSQTMDFLYENSTEFSNYIILWQL